MLASMTIGSIMLEVMGEGRWVKDEQKLNVLNLNRIDDISVDIFTYVSNILNQLCANKEWDMPENDTATL